MQPTLVFIHGWGFDQHFWDRVAARLIEFHQIQIDLGFFGMRSPEIEPAPGQILIGHSLGFVHGLKMRQDWAGWIAINSFPRFVATEVKTGCVPEAKLREMRLRLQKDTGKTLHDFYKFVGAEPVHHIPNAEHLREGLDELRDIDAGEILKTMHVPGLALAGRNDPLVPLEASEALGRMAKPGGLIVHDEMGHLLPLTAPSWCVLAIENFLATCFDRE